MSVFCHLVKKLVSLRFRFSKNQLLLVFYFLSSADFVSASTSATKDIPYGVQDSNESRTFDFQENPNQQILVDVAPMVNFPGIGVTYNLNLSNITSDQAFVVSPYFNFFNFRPKSDSSSVRFKTQVWGLDFRYKLESFLKSGLYFGGGLVKMSTQSSGSVSAIATGREVEITPSNYSKLGARAIVGFQFMSDYFKLENFLFDAGLTYGLGQKINQRLVSGATRNSNGAVESEFAEAQVLDLPNEIGAFIGLGLIF
jgi:hypothetical protein